MLLLIFFSGDKISDLAGENGNSLTTTVRHDNLPSVIPKKHLHHKRVISTVCTKACRFLKPVVLKKEVGFAPNQKNKKIHVAMQSTSSCNFGSVN